MMELLYRYFVVQFWSFKYNQNNSNATAFANSIIWMLVVLSSLTLLVVVVYKHIILGEPPLPGQTTTKGERYMQVIAYLIVGYQVLKWLVIKKMGFDIETGTSSRYNYIPTKRQRNICLIISILLFLSPVVVLVLLQTML